MYTRRAEKHYLNIHSPRPPFMAEAELNRWLFHCVPEHREVQLCQTRRGSKFLTKFPDFNPLLGTILS